jgi:hypothetical protein
MRTFVYSWATCLVLLALGCLLASARIVGGSPPHLPRFTEEREAAARHFVKKHLAELLPLLDQLKKSSAQQYEQEIRAIFRVSELLADFRDETQRHDLELKIWIAENRANILLAKLATPNEEERKKLHMQLQELTDQLVRLDLDILDLRVEALERELGEAKDESARIRDQREKYAKDRYDGLLKRIDKRKK